MAGGGAGRGEPPGRSPRGINEIGDGPESGEQAWVEIYNRTGMAVDLDGWMLSSDVASPTHVALPPWTMPGRSYLIVGLGRGIDDPDFSDVVATHYATLGFTSELDGAALYRGTPGSDTIEDFAAWSHLGR